jgi:hypothetical protein
MQQQQTSMTDELINFLCEMIMIMIATYTQVQLQQAPMSSNNFMLKGKGPGFG